ncbi:MAG: hypothetical protein ACR652_00840 [Methylocystis sp.]|uniref:hypothetical protein n=1 Tax=Methylocystis sp. TaxID=1911079 RepID=UPI003DA65DC2
MFPKTATRQKIASFASLREGWHYGRGGPISGSVLSDATQVYHSFLLNGFSRTDAFAGAGGEVLVTAYYVSSGGDDHYVAAMINPSHSFTLRHELNDVDVESDYIESQSLNVIRNGVARIAREIWNTSGLSIQETSTSIKAGSTIWRSKTLRMGQECQSSRYRALRHWQSDPAAA